MLKAVLESKGFAKAADTLGMTQSGVSRAIAKLESNLGVRLLERTTRAVHLTDEGRRFLDEILPLLSEMDSVVSRASQKKEVVSGRLRINADSLFCSTVLAPRIFEFTKMFPEVEVELMATDRLADFLSNGYDLAIRFIEPTNDGLICRKILGTKVVTVASPAYLKKYGTIKSPRDLKEHECLHFRNSDTGRAFDWEFERGKKIVTERPKGRLLFSDPASLLNACLSGAGVAQLLGFYCEELIQQKRLIRLLPDWSNEQFPLYALFASRKHQPAKVKAFMAFIEPIVQGRS